MTTFLLIEGWARAGWSEAWEGSRWHLLEEAVLPAPVSLGPSDNHTIRTRSLQWEGILACGEVTPAGRHAGEIDCRLEELAVRAVSGGAPEHDTSVLEDTTELLRSATVRLGLREDRGVMTVDLLEVPATTRRESEQRELLRRLVSDLVAPLRLASGGSADTWVERNTALVRAPGQAASVGTSRVVHTLREEGGSVLVESVGSGSFTAPFVPWEFEMSQNVPSSPGRDKLVGERMKTTLSGPMTVPVVHYDSGPPPTFAPSDTSPTDQLFVAELSAVAVLDAAGTPTERVWAMTARPAGAVEVAGVWYSGHVTRLAPGETPTLGATGPVAPPGAELAGLPAWVPVDGG